jgi:hypothetical protein
MPGPGTGPPTLWCRSRPASRRFTRSCAGADRVPGDAQMAHPAALRRAFARAGVDDLRFLHDEPPRESVGRPRADRALLPASGSRLHRAAGAQAMTSVLFAPSTTRRSHRAAPSGAPRRGPPRSPGAATCDRGHPQLARPRARSATGDHRRALSGEAPAGAGRDALGAPQPAHLYLPGTWHAARARRAWDHPRPGKAALVGLGGPSLGRPVLVTIRDPACSVHWPLPCSSRGLVRLLDRSIWQVCPITWRTTPPGSVAGRMRVRPRRCRVADNRPASGCSRGRTGHRREPGHPHVPDPAARRARVSCPISHRRWRSCPMP